MTHPTQQCFQPTGSVSLDSTQQQNDGTLHESFEALRQEFSAIVSDVGHLRDQRDEFEAKTTARINEFQNQLQSFEAQNIKVRQQAKDELAELKQEGSDWYAISKPKVKRALDLSLLHTLMHESVVCCVRFSADGRFLATGCNRTAQIYDTQTGGKICVLVDDSMRKAGDLYIRSVCFSPDGRYLATGAEDKQIRIWDIANKCIRNVFDGHQQEIYSLDFSPDGRLIVSGSGDKTARIWDMDLLTSKVLTINDQDSLNNDATVTSVAFSPNGRLVAAGSLDGVVRIWDVATERLMMRLRGHCDSVYSVTFTPDGNGLVSGSLDRMVKYWDVSGLTGEMGGNGITGWKDEGGAGLCTMNFMGHKDYVMSVGVSHDGQWVVSGSKDRSVQFWDTRSTVPQCVLQGHKGSVISMDLSPTGNILATGSGDWQARIWSYNSV